MSDIEYNITWLGGVKELKPVEWRITTQLVGRWWPRTRFFLETDFCRLGPLKTRDEAEKYLEFSNF